VNLNLARTLPRSEANGPGERFVVWVQGCPLACAGCWNPDTWSFARRDVRAVSALVADITATTGIEGITFTGGEPFSQARALAKVARSVRAEGLSVFVFTGYELGELSAEAQRALLDETDVLVAGRYVEAERVEGLPWRGSRNQRVHFLSARYGDADLAGALDVEVRIEGDGSIKVVGFPGAGLLRGFGDAAAGTG